MTSQSYRWQKKIRLRCDKSFFIFLTNTMLILKCLIFISEHFTYMS